jgi:hypothetical protein
MQFKAFLDKITMDKDGECKIVLCVSLQDRKAVLELAEKTEKILDIEIKPEF